MSVSGMTARRLVTAGDRKADFPGLAGNWAYLDTAATAQKPQIVIDAMRPGVGRRSAAVLRGVYKRSADMTVAIFG